MDANKVKNVGFGFQAFKKFPEIVPLVSIMGVAIVGVSAWCGYALMSKTDVMINRSKMARWEKIDVNQPQKLMTIGQKYGEDPEITALKAELAEAYKAK